MKLNNIKSGLGGTAIASMLLFGMVVPGAAFAVSVNASGYSNHPTNAKFAGTSVTNYSGYLGIRNPAESSSSPHHAVDNNGQVDAVLFSFGADVRLTQVLFGWSQGDADFSVLYSTGAAPCLSTYKLNQLRAEANCLANGNNWQLLGSFDANASGSPVTTNLPSSGIYARNWLVMAYNAFDSSCSTCDSGDDYFKVNVNYEVRKVPEPGSLALLGLGLAGLGLAGRRRT